MKPIEAVTERSRPSSSSSSSSVRRKPLSDSTNFLVPTSTILRKLSSSLSTKPPFPNPVPKANPKPKPNPIPISKPCNSSANKPDANSSKSDISIGSSNYNDNASNPSTIPQPHPSTPPRVSITTTGNGCEEVFEPLVVYSRRQTAEKTKAKGKAVSVPFTCSPLQKTKDNVKADTVPFTFPLPQKTKDKGKATALPFTCSFVKETRDKRKAVTVSPSFPPPGKSKDNGKPASVPISFHSLVNTRNKRKTVPVPFCCPPMPRARKIQNEFNEARDIGLSKSCTVPHPKHKKKRCCLLPEQDVSKHALPQEYIKQQRAYFKEIDDFELPEEEVSENELDNE